MTTPPGATVNGVSLCVKGRYGTNLSTTRIASLNRACVVICWTVAPRDRSAGRGGWVEVDWDTALEIVARRLRGDPAESGPNSIGLLASAKCTNEENYLMQKFARQVIGTHNIDHCARLCHSSTVTGLAMAFGSGAMSNTMRDIAEQARPCSSSAPTRPSNTRSSARISGRRCCGAGCRWW